MKYADPELMRQLGAEYVLGTLRGPARRRFERMLRANPEARAQVDFWEQRMGEFGQALVPVPPPAAARVRLLRSVSAPGVPVVLPPALPPAAPLRRARARRRHGWAWPYAAGFTTAASLVLAFLLGQRTPTAPSPAPFPVLALDDHGAAALPIFLARIGVPASTNVQWLVSVSSDHRQFNVVAADDFLQLGRYRAQLWCQLPGQTTRIPLGALPTTRDGSAAFDFPASLRGQPELRFVITLEPAGTSPGNPPSGQVLSEAVALDAI